MSKHYWPSDQDWHIGWLLLSAVVLFGFGLLFGYITGVFVTRCPV